MDEGAQITVEDVRQFNAKIIQLVDLADLLPILRDKKAEGKAILSEEIVQKVSSKRNTQFERSSFLLNYLYQQGQIAINAFVESLRESKSADHAQILRLLEGDLLEAEPTSPLFSILEKHLDVIVANVNLVSLLKSLLSIQAIPVNTFLDLQNADRTLKETLEKLFPVLEKQGSRGFINFLSCLQKDTQNPGHEKLSELLFEEVKRFFKEHPHRDRVSQSDQIEILQLERREKVIGQEIQQRMVRHRDTLAAQINVPAVLPSLLKTQIITRQDMEYLSKLDPGHQGDKLIDLLLGKELSMVIKFAECLKESPDNREAGELLMPSPQSASSVAKRPDQVLEKYDKLAIFACAEHYLSPNGLPTSLEPQPFDQPVREHRETLKRQLEAMDFHIVTLETSVDADDYSDTLNQSSKFLNVKFKDEVAKHCSEGAVVIVFLSGIQFPSKSDKGEFYGAVLRSNASKYGRLPSDSVECSDLVQWVGLLPGAHVTILVDTDPSHVVAYDKTQQVTKVEIMEDPWSSLTAFDCSTVVIYLQPDPEAMAVSRGADGRSQSPPLGMLTEVFTKAIVSCVLKSKDTVSHRALFEAISFYWYTHEGGRMHKLYKPAMVGDVDRQFLGTTVIPYQQVFRADLQRREKEKGFSNEIKIPTGTMAGLIQGDHLEVFHPLRPGVRVRGQITESYQLHSKAALDKGEWPRLHDVLQEVYQSGSLSGDAGFLFVRKKFPLHQRLSVYPRELGRGETNTLKSYIKDRSNLLSYVPQEKEAMAVVRIEDQLFVLEDQAGDIKYPMRTRSVERVKSLLEILAWFKYVKALKSKSKRELQYECSLTAAQPLLSAAAPLCWNFNISWSSCVGVNPASLGFEAILNFNEPPQFWAPSRGDPSSNLRVQFRRNQLITAIELRGDLSYPKFVREASVEHKRIISEGTITADNKSLALSEDEKVQFVIVRANVEPEAKFSVTLSVKVRRPGTKKGNYLDRVGVFEPWPIPQHWGFSPRCDQQGVINLAPANHRLTWSGIGGGRLVLNLFDLPVHFDKIEVLDQKNVKELSVCLESGYFVTQISVSSPYPKRVTFPRPIVASTVVVRPTKLGDHQVFSPPLSVMPNAGDIRLQLQLHGNAHGEPLVVNEQGLMNFQFNSFMNKQLYFYILCLEETGCISLLNEGKEEAPLVIQQGEGQPFYPAERMYLQAEIPKNYTPDSGYMQDEYRVWVSSTRLYVEPFIQTGISSCLTPICYNVCTQGHTTRQVVGDEWVDHHYTVRIKKS